MASKLIVNEIEHTDGSGTAVTMAKATIADATIADATITTGSIPAASITGVLPAGVTGGSGLTALGTVASGNLSNTAIVYPEGHVLQTKQVYNTGNMGSTSSTNVSFGVPSTSAAITITSGNYVLVTMTANIYSGGNFGGIVYMGRGVGPGNSSSDMLTDTFKTHADNMCYVSGMSASLPHWYNTTGGHSYGMFTYQLLDTQLSRHTTPTQPQYSLGLGKHASGSGIYTGGNWSYPVTWTLQEIQT